MTKERAQVLWEGIRQSFAENGSIIMPPRILEELREAGFYKDGDVDIKALRAFARAGCPASIRQHVPPFVEGGNPKTAKFKSLSALLRVPWVAKWAADASFHRFSVNNRIRQQPLLMAEFENGSVWYVVGFLTEVPAGLPVWEPRERIQ